MTELKESQKSEILKEADLLGKMLQQTEVFQEFSHIQDEFQGNTESRENLLLYSSLAQDIKNRQAEGEVVEPGEFERLRELADTVSADPLSMNYLQARDRYVELLESIQNSLVDEGA
jgi:cell fate (sporulation/competence/biofilm development) regulator YlbF (YheA/YmcA/DUF963 family)